MVIPVIFWLIAVLGLIFTSPPYSVFEMIVAFLDGAAAAILTISFFYIKKVDIEKMKNIDRQDKTEEESLIRITLYITEDLLCLKEIKSQTNERIKRLEKERNKINSYLFKKEKKQNKTVK